MTMTTSTLQGSLSTIITTSGKDSHQNIVSSHLSDVGLKKLSFMKFLNRLNDNEVLSYFPLFDN